MNTQKADRWPAWLDILQAISALVLVLFMWMHMLLVSSILLGKDAMYFVARFFEGVYFFGQPYPVLVSIIAAAIFFLIVVHALIALRKTPGNYQQYKNFYIHMKSFHHSDTTLWFIQLVTGLVLMFLAAIHLYQMFSEPAGIGPYASADRVWSDNLWPLYLVLLFSVELHGGIGLYRLIIKWGLFGRSNLRKIRRNLQIAKWTITVFFLLLGLATLAAYMKLGIEHADHAGERYQPAPAKIIDSYRRESH
jgi:fumarate reductase subunit C